MTAPYKKHIIRAVVIFVALFGSSQCDAEKIYYKNGKVVKAQVTSRSRGNLWIGHGEGVSSGILMKNVSRIENDDGSVSKYDYETLEKLINEAIAKSQYKEAVKLCGVFLEGSPGYPRVRYLRAMMNHKIGNLEETYKAIKAADTQAGYIQDTT